MQIMLCGIELQEVSNSEGSQVVAVTRKQETPAVTETITITMQQQVNATQQQPAAPNNSRKCHILIILLSLCSVIKLLIVFFFNLVIICLSVCPHAICSTCAPDSWTESCITLKFGTQISDVFTDDSSCVNALLDFSSNCDRLIQQMYIYRKQWYTKYMMFPVTCWKLYLLMLLSFT